MYRFCVVKCQQQNCCNTFFTKIGPYPLQIWCPLLVLCLVINPRRSSFQHISVCFPNVEKFIKHCIGSKHCNSFVSHCILSTPLVNHYTKEIYYNGILCKWWKRECEENWLMSEIVLKQLSIIMPKGIQVRVHQQSLKAAQVDWDHIYLLLCPIISMCCPDWGNNID